MLPIASLQRIEAYVIDIVGKYQCGFAKGISTSNYVFTLRQTMEKYYAFNRQTYIGILYIDFKQMNDISIENNYR